MSTSGNKPHVPSLAKAPGTGGRCAVWKVLRPDEFSKRSSDQQRYPVGFVAMLRMNIVTETLRKASSGEACLDGKVNIGSDTTFSRQFEMRENDVWLVELRPTS